jgi:MFS family permease
VNSLKKSVFYISFPLYFIGFIFPIYALKTGASIAEIGYLYALFSIIGILVRPLVGSLIDTSGRKTCLLTGTILYVFSYLFYALASDFRVLLMARIIQGVAASFLWISVETIVADISNNNNISENFGIINQTETKGQFVGSIIAFSILSNSYISNTFRKVFIVFFVTSLISLYYSFKKIPDTRVLIKDIKPETVTKRSNLYIFLVIICSVSFISSLTGPIYLLYLQENITADLGLIAVLFIPGAILSSILPRIFGRLSDKYSRERIVVIGLFINAVLQIFIPMCNAYYTFMVVYTLISISLIIFSPALSSLVVDYVGRDKRGKSYGLYSLVAGIGSAIGPVAGSYIYENISIDMVFILKGILMIIITTIFHFFSTRNFLINSK